MAYGREEKKNEFEGSLSSFKAVKMGLISSL